MSNYRIVKPTADDLFLEAAKNFHRLARQAVDAKGEFNVALAGGSTPKRFYQILSSPPYSATIPWGKIHLFFTDERQAGPDSPESNFAMANRYLLKNINIDPLHVHRIAGELEANDAAKNYNLILSSFLPRNANGVPLIDLVLLGLGADGHVASLFPETDILDVTDRYAAAVWLEEMKTWRVSITLPVINSAAHVWVMVTGESKHDILERVINFPSATNPLPIEQVKPASGLIWYLDAAAAKWLK